MKLPVLEDVVIATPCTASWDAMIGTDRVRHCASCGLNVYNLSAMTRREARTFLAKELGFACVRLYKRADGTVITQDCPTALARARRRVSAKVVAAASLIGALLSAVIAVAVNRFSSAEKSLSAIVEEAANARRPGDAVPHAEFVPTPTSGDARVSYMGRFPSDRVFGDSRKGETSEMGAIGGLSSRNRPR